MSTDKELLEGIKEGVEELHKQIELRDIELLRLKQIIEIFFKAERGKDYTEQQVEGMWQEFKKKRNL